MISLKDDVANEIDSLPSLDDVKGEPKQPEPEAESQQADEENQVSEEHQNDDVHQEQDDDSSDMDFDLDDDDEGEASDTHDDEKRYSKKQLEHRLKKVAAQDKRRRDRLERELADMRAKVEAFSQFNQSPDIDPPQGNNADMSPQEYATQVVNNLEKQRQAAALYQQKVEKGSKKYKDFEQVVNSGSYSREMVEAAEDFDNEEDILYYLGKRDDVAYEIMQLSPAKQAAKVAKLSQQLAARKSKKKIVSNAPDPAATPKPSNKSAKAQTALGYVDMLADPNMSFKELAAMRARKA